MSTSPRKVLGAVDINTRAQSESPVKKTSLIRKRSDESVSSSYSKTRRPLRDCTSQHAGYITVEGTKHQLTTKWPAEAALSPVPSPSKKQQSLEFVIFDDSNKENIPPSIPTSSQATLS